MVIERIRKMQDAIQRSRAIRAESQQRKEESRKLLEEADRRVKGGKASRRKRNGLTNDRRTPEQDREEDNGDFR
jgi:hypothetical protein